MNQETRILTESQNPFEIGRINLYDPWENPLNSDVFNAMVRRKLYDEIMRFAERDEGAFSEFRVLVGDKGEGKTHILCNLRDQLIGSGRCIFIYIKPETLDSYNYDGSDSNSHIYYHILRQIENSVLQQLSGKQRGIIISTILNHYVIPFVKRKYHEDLPEVTPTTLQSFNNELREVLRRNKVSLEALHNSVRTSYIAESKVVDHETVYYLFKYALFNFDNNNLVNLSKWLKGARVGDKRIGRTDKALSAIKTINDIIVRSGKCLVIVFDQFERTVSEKQIRDNLSGENIQDDLYNKMDIFFSNIWRLMEESRKLFFIFSLREENWRAFKAYLKTVRSHLESRFSDIYVVGLEELTEEKSLAILGLFMEKLVYEPLGINQNELITEIFPYFKDDQERERKLSEYIGVINLGEVSDPDISQWTIKDYYDLSISDDKKRYIIRSFLEECAKAYVQLMDAYRYKTPIEKERFFPNTSHIRPIKYISSDFIRSIKGQRNQRDVIESIKIYLTTLITEYSFVRDISVLPFEDGEIVEADFKEKRIQKLVELRELLPSDGDSKHKLLLRIQFPQQTTTHQLRNAKMFLDKDGWLLAKEPEIKFCERGENEYIRRQNFEHRGSFDISRIQNLIDKMDRDLKFVFSVRLVGHPSSGGDVGRVGTINYDSRTIAVLLPHRYTKINRQAKIILGLDRSSTPEAMDKAKNILGEWVGKEV
jgi:hypothetical protein